MLSYRIGVSLHGVHNILWQVTQNSQNYKSFPKDFVRILPIWNGLSHHFVIIPSNKICSDILASPMSCFMYVFRLVVSLSKYDLSLMGWFFIYPQSTHIYSQYHFCLSVLYWSRDEIASFTSILIIQIDKQFLILPTLLYVANQVQTICWYVWKLILSFKMYRVFIRNFLKWLHKN